jgi:trimethylamine--corrinoid protein Co-methyltransferase
MREVCLGGPGHYLGSSETLRLMETEYIYPKLADRSSPKEWEELGRPCLLARAKARKEAILAASTTPLVDPEVDRAVRARFNIRF